MTSKLNITIKPEKFGDLQSKLEDLAKISDTIKLKIDDKDVLMYSIVGETVLLAFKSYIIKTDDYFQIKEEVPETLDVIISGAKRFVKNLGFIKTSEKILFTIDYRTDDELSLARFIQIKNGKLKVALQGGETSEVRDISKQVLEKRVDTKLSKWSFKIERSEFQDIKKLCNINSDGKVIHLNVEKGNVLLSETSTWEFEVDKVDDVTDRHLMFNKTFLPSIDDTGESVNFFVFETFILTKDENSNLMISFEQDFSVDD